MYHQFVFTVRKLFKVLSTNPMTIEWKILAKNSEMTEAGERRKSIFIGHDPRRST